MLLHLADADRDRIAALGRPAASALAIHQALQRQPLFSSATLAKTTSITQSTVNKSLRFLLNLDIVAELTSRQRGIVFSYHRYVDCLNREL